MRIPIANTKKQLSIIWFSGSGFLFALLLLQTIFGKFGTEAKDAWGLILPTFMPTLSLIIGTLVVEATAAAKNTEETVTVDRFFFHLSRFLSIAYLSTVILTILLSPFSKLSLLELIKLSNLWLAPFQGLVTASLGAFFVSRE